MPTTELPSISLLKAVILISFMNTETKYNKHLEDEASKKNKELDSYRNTTTKRHIETPSVRQQEPPRLGSRQVLPPHGNNRKRYASVVAATAETKHKALVRSKINQTPEMIKNQLKSKVDKNRENLTQNA